MPASIEKDQEVSHIEHGLGGNIPKLGNLDATDLDAELEALDKVVEASLRRKYDQRIVPVMALIYLMSFIDRSNMGNAKIMGMEKDLKLKGYDFNIALTGFFITYILFEVPANVLCKRFGPRFWLSFITLSFGLITMCISFTTSHRGLVVARLFLGMAEAGIMPGIAYALSTFYRRHELVARVGIYASVASIAGGFGGLLATGFSQIPNWGMLHSWRNIFFFEGIMTTIAAMICWTVLPNSPAEAKFLTQEERELGARRIYLETLSRGHEKLTKTHFSRSILNFNTWLMGIGMFCSLLVMNSVALFMPSLLKAMGYTAVMAQLMSVPPYVVGSIVCISCAMTSDRLKSRGLVLITVAAPAIIIGFTLLYTVDIIAVKYFALFLATMGGFTASPMIIAWLVDNSAGPTIRAVAGAFAVGVGCTGGLVATWTYLPSEAPGYKSGHVMNLCAGILLLIVLTVATVYLRWENRQRDLGRRDDRLVGKTEQEVAQLGHSHPAFRFTP